jgi:CDP-diacylglycerol--glycerol-3-phosphate 3-phosphatidyltransferase
VARRYNAVTDIGKFLDPLADKVMVATALILLVNLNRAPAWIALIIILREMVITGLRGVASTRGTVIAASSLGKSKTVVQDVALTGLLIHGRLDLGYDFLPSWLTGHNVGMIVLYIAVFYTLYSGYDYIRKFVASESAAEPRA